MPLINCLKLTLASTMKRKRNSESTQSYDLVLTDASGRSVRTHRALLIEKSDYFARLLQDHNLRELHLNENHLIELIRYLYSHDSDYTTPETSPQLESVGPTLSDDFWRGSPPTDEFANLKPEANLNQDSSRPVVALVPASDDSSSQEGDAASAITNIDIEVLMRMLLLAKKYGFRQLYRSLINEINYKLCPNTAITIYKSARELGIGEFSDQARMMILSCLPQLLTNEEFLALDEDSVRDIFSAEAPDIECDGKVEALSAWWSSNKQANVTDLWVKFMMSN